MACVLPRSGRNQDDGLHESVHRAGQGALDEQARGRLQRLFTDHHAVRILGKAVQGCLCPPWEGLHFSMWGSAQQKDGTVNMATAPRIIASSIPNAHATISDNEGTTVRGGGPFSTSPARSVIQAMRATKETDGARTYYGYYGYLYDEERQRWRLYTAGQLGANKGH